MWTIEGVNREGGGGGVEKRGVGPRVPFNTLDGAAESRENTHL